MFLFVSYLDGGNGFLDFVKKVLRRGLVLSYDIMD